MRRFNTDNRFTQNFSENRGEIDVMPTQEKKDEMKTTDDGRVIPAKRSAMANIYNKALMSYLVQLYEELGGNKVDLNEIGNIVDALHRLRERQEKSYMKALLYPEKQRGAKIPSPMPVPSTAFQLRQSTTLTTNSKGNLALSFNPVFLTSNSNFTNLLVNNDESLNGISPSDAFKPAFYGGAISPVYSRFRLVSASITLRYIGRLDIVQGICGGGIVYDPSYGLGVNLGGVIGTSPPAAKYGDFNLVRDSYYFQENHVLDGIRILYFPIDNSYEEYRKVGSVADNNLEAIIPGFNMLIYVMSGVPDSTSYKVDICCNFECIPETEFLNYIPVTCAPKASETEKKEAVNAVQARPVTTEQETRSYHEDSGKSTWDTIVDTAGAVLPAITEIVGWLF